MHSILIADDDMRIRQLIRSMVSEAASAVHEARDEEEAVEIYAAQRPDWVLMDLRMKPVDGLRATARIMARFPEARIVILTQHDDPGLRKAAREAGASGYVLKEDVSQLPAPLRDFAAPGRDAKPFTSPPL
jgi:DNA-binding NarL/FixJ family response regulator